MATLRNVRTLTRYMAWANDRIYEAVAALPEGEATKPRRSVFKNIVHTLNHVYVIDLIFQAHLEGREHGFTARNTPDWPQLDELRHKQSALDHWYIAWSDRLTEVELDRKVHFTYVGGGEGVMTCAEIALHLANHTTYHRGYIADMLYQVPANPPTTDLTVFIRDVPRMKTS
jgi:uncharacterized damage-inducible protein DinB